MTASPVSVLILVENLPVPFDRRVWMEATTLRANGYEVAVVCPTGKGFTTRREILDGIRIYRYPLAEADSVVGYFGEYGRALSSSLHMCLKAYRERPFDVIHLCNPPDLLFLVALWFKFGRGVKVIFDHHDVTPEMYLAKYDDRRDLLYRAVVLSERLTFATADIVIATSETGREIAHRRGHKCPGDVFLVRSGPDMARFTPVPPDPALKNGSKHLIGYLGVMGEQEGVDHVIRAAKYIREELGRDDVSFALIGDGPASQDLRALADALGTSAYVRFTGRIPDAEMVELLCTCDVCVSPDPKNAYNDACVMNKVLEYMALKRPIVQYDLVEGRRSAGDASLYARPGDERHLAQLIVELIDDEARRKFMGDEGYRRMTEELEWRHQAPKLLEAYTAALRKKSEVTVSAR
ncbi:MAG TPA: glycosyltransferase family 4 protein [Coriobacteriia bacterium]